MSKYYKTLFKQIYDVAEETKYLSERNKLLAIVDILWCGLKYGASPNNYKSFEFYKLNAKQRSTYVTHAISEKMIKIFNNNEYRDIFENKINFAQKFNQFFGRKWISNRCSLDEFKTFAKDSNKIIYKPLSMAQGAGIKVINNIDNAENIYNQIKKLPYGIVEDWIDQHKVLSDIYPKAVNCLRIITVYKDDKLNMLAGGVTFALHNEIANGSLDSIIAPIDLVTGIINKPAATFGGILYENHPLTNKRIYGVQLPYWNETKELLYNAARLVPEVRYVGWDVAITPKGPILMEGNTSPGYRYYQIPAHSHKKGNRYLYERLLK